MHLQNYKIICTSISIALFIIAACGFIFGFSQIDADPVILRNITPYGFMLLSIGLVVIWQGFGLTAGLIFFMLCFPLIILASFSLGSYTHNFQVITMIGAGVVSHIFYKKNSAILLAEDEEIERLQEEQNILDDQIKKDSELTQALAKRIDRYNMLKDLGESLNAKLSLGEICQLAIDKACQIIGKTDEAKLFLLTEDAQELMLWFWKTKEGLDTPSKEADIFDRWVFEKRQPLQIPDAAEDFRFNSQQDKEQHRYNCLIIVPLIIQHRIMGILRLGSKMPNTYTADDLRLLDFISDLAGAAVNNARLYIQTQELAIRDSLTGLYVHRYFKERFANEFIRCNQQKETLSVLMMDIDHFKDYNDMYGHAAGDKVLKGITDIMCRHAQEASVLARYGGEEFAALFPGTDKKKAKYIAENIRKEIETTPFVLRRQETKVTVSIGVSSFPDDAASEEELFKRADFLLYKAKREGRNKICID